MTQDPVLPDKIQLLMEEASCDRAEAELAMSLAGFNLEKAIRTIGTLLRHIVVVKGKFVESTQNLHGLLILIADTRRDHFIRARAVVSYNPALYETSLGQHWYEFERAIYAARLAEGALQQVSQELERSFIDHVEARREEFFSAIKSPAGTNLAGVLKEEIEKSFPRGVQAIFSPEVIDWNQFRRFPFKGEDRGVSVVSQLPEGERSLKGDTLRIRLELVEDPQGPPLRDVSVGDRVAVLLSDKRDIARYLAKLFGAMNEKGPQSFDAPVETIQKENGHLRLHLRLSTGILGLADAPDSFHVHVLPRETESWWRRLINRDPS